MMFTERKAEGSITVYLSLILLLLLSLVLTVIEGARVSTAKVYSQRALSTAMDSVLAEYYGPLWKEYHIFGYNTGEGSDSEKALRIEEKLSDYMLYTFNPGYDLSQELISNTLELFGISPDSVTVSEQTSLADYEGGLFINEAVEYMKYGEVADVAERLLDKFSLLEEPKIMSIIYSEKFAAEEELVAIDTNLLRLMEVLDGIKTSKKGIEQDWEGKLIMSKYFVKMICCDTVTSEKININNSTVFQAVCHYYINPAEQLDKTAAALNSLKQKKQLLLQIKEKQSANAQAIQSVRLQLQTLDNGAVKAEEVQSKIASVKAIMMELQAVDSILAQDYKVNQEQVKEYEASIKGVLKTLRNSVNEVEPLIEEAIDTVEDSIGIASKAEVLIRSFEKALSDEREGLGEDILAKLEEELENMKHYIAECKEENSYMLMSEILQFNQKLLYQIDLNLGKAVQAFENEDYETMEDFLFLCVRDFREYDISGLKLDYSSMIFQSEKQKNPFKDVINLLQQGLTGLVIDPQTISQKELSSGRLPSTGTGEVENIDFSGLLIEFIKRCNLSDSKIGLQGLMSRFGNTIDLFADAEGGINQISELVLFQEYIKEHFNRYEAASAVNSTKKPLILEYEQEYLLDGGLSDEENVSSVITKITFIRMMMDFISLLGDQSKCQEALTAATALIGFTGLPILISITKTALLLLLAFAEALTDTCALLMGQEVPLIKNNTVMNFPELFLLNRNYLQSKVLKIEATGLSFSYQDYLSLFLLLKARKVLAYRSMDLIQENINLRYEKVFYITNCLFGFRAAADYHINAKFLAIPYVKGKIVRNITAFTYTANQTYSY